jgi:putative addiction module component (TIGR02574 family)
MTSEAREIEQKALSLSTLERESLANHLFQSVHNQELSEIDEAWLSLAEERWNAYQANPQSGIEKKYSSHKSGILSDGRNYCRIC